MLKQYYLTSKFILYVQTTIKYNKENKCRVIIGILYIFEVAKLTRIYQMSKLVKKQIANLNNNYLFGQFRNYEITILRVFV
jgi:hypothetical protein